jgi:hypothetical protein
VPGGEEIVRAQYDRAVDVASAPGGDQQRRGLIGAGHLGPVHDKLAEIVGGEGMIVAPFDRSDESNLVRDWRPVGSYPLQQAAEQAELAVATNKTIHRSPKRS